MSRAVWSTKVIALATILLFFGVSAATASPTVVLKDNSVWLNHEPVHEEGQVSCSQSGYVSVAGTVVANKSGNWSHTLTTGDFHGNGYGERTITVSCSGTVEKTVTVKELNITVMDAGSGFVGQQLGTVSTTPVSNVAPIKLKVSKKTGNGTEQIDLSQLRFTTDDHRADIQNDPGYVEIQDDGTILLYPKITEYIKPSNSLEIDATYQGKDELTETLATVPTIYQWKLADIYNAPQMPEDFSYVRNRFSIQLDLKQYGSNTGQLARDNFVLTIKEVKEDGEETVVADKNWLQPSMPNSGEHGNYELTLDNVPNLDTGSYKFLIGLQYTDANEKTHQITLNTFRIEKYLRFAGTVTDVASTSPQVPTEMTVLEAGGRTVSVEARDGSYDARLQDRAKALTMKFFKQETDKVTSVIDIRAPDLKSKSSSGNTAIGYQYREDSEVHIEGVQPVNMMAVKFAHPIRGGASATMTFNPLNRNLDELSVYECSDWNFQQTTCMGEWQKMADEAVSVNPASWEVGIDDLNLRHLPDSGADILINAYVVGIPSKLVLDGNHPVEPDAETVAAGDTVSVGGRVLATNGDHVQDADVTLELVDETGATAETFTTTTDADGSFTVEGAAPTAPGTYHIRASVQKQPYKPVEMTSDATITTYYETGVALDPETTRPTIDPGTTSTVSFDIVNTGQAPIKQPKITVKGLERGYTLRDVPSQIDGGSATTVTLVLDASESCSPSCNDRPVLDISVEGMSDGKQVTAATTIYTQVDAAYRTGQEAAESGIQKGGDVAAPVGNVIRSWSDGHLLLGLGVFLIVFAVAVWRKRRSASRGGRTGPVQGSEGARQSKIQTPQIAASDDGSKQAGKPRQYSTEREKVDDGSREVVDERTVSNQPDISATTLPNKKKESGEDGHNAGQNVSGSDREIVDEPDSYDGASTGAMSTGTKDAVEDTGSGMVDDAIETVQDRTDDESTAEENGEFVCEETGEVFETQAALDLYKKINGLD